MFEGHCLIHAHVPPEQKFHFIFGQRTKLPSVWLEPDILLRIRASHPVRQPMVKLARTFLRTCWVSISREDRILLRIGHAARSLSVRYTRQRCVHFAGGQFWIG